MMKKKVFSTMLLKFKKENDSYKIMNKETNMGSKESDATSISIPKPLRKYFIQKKIFEGSVALGRGGPTH